MDKKTKEQIRKKIAEEISKTTKAIAEYKEQSQPISPENAIGRISRMDAINNKSIVEAALVQAEEKLKKLQLVEHKIEDEDFGLCSKCGKEIPLGRLMLMPQSHLCVHCAR
mgnify:CR=1 FL=1